MDEEHIVPATYGGNKKSSGSNTGLLIVIFLLLLILVAGGAFLFGANRKAGQELAEITPTPTEGAAPTEVLGESITPTPTSTPTPTPTSTFKVTSVAAAVAVPSNSCPTTSIPITLVFTATITTNEVGTVKYQWERSDGSTPIQGTISFSEAGTKTVNNNWKFFGPYEGSAKLTVTSPNVIKSNDANFKLVCFIPLIPSLRPLPYPSP